MGKDFSKSLFLLTLMISLNTSLIAGVIRPLQIMLPGNLGGNLISFSSEQKVKSSEAFKLPYAIKAFKKEHDKDSIIFGIGNDSSVFKAFSFLTEGKAEREIIEKCQPFAAGLSPNDLEVFSMSYLDNQIKKRVFTNVETLYNQEIFQPYSLINQNGQSIYFFNFIAPDYCSKLPLNRWSEIKAGNIARSLRKANPKLSGKDFSISVLYGNRKDSEELSKELKRFEGTHFIINVPIKGEAPLFSTNSPEPLGNNVFSFSVKPGTDFLPILNIIPKTFGQPRTTLRMIPLAKFSESAAHQDYKITWEKYKEAFHKPLKVIPATKKATTSANRLSSQAHAEMLKYVANTEIAIVKTPAQISFNESVMTVGNMITRFPNDRIIKFKATEVQLKNLFSGIIKDGSMAKFNIAGCNFSNLGSHFWDFEINHQSIDRKRLFTLATTETTAQEPSLKRLLDSCAIEEYKGLTLWEAWINNLQSFNPQGSKLFDF